MSRKVHNAYAYALRLEKPFLDNCCKDGPILIARRGVGQAGATAAEHLLAMSAACQAAAGAFQNIPLVGPLFSMLKQVLEVVQRCAANSAAVQELAIDTALVYVLFRKIAAVRLRQPLRESRVRDNSESDFALVEKWAKQNTSEMHLLALTRVRALPPRAAFISRRVVITQQPRRLIDAITTCVFRM